MEPNRFNPTCSCATQGAKEGIAIVEVIADYVLAMKMRL
jgi:hypothetical protein